MKGLDAEAMNKVPIYRDGEVVKTNVHPWEQECAVIGHKFLSSTVSRKQLWLLEQTYLLLAEKQQSQARL